MLKRTALFHLQQNKFDHEKPLPATAGGGGGGGSSMKLILISL